MMGSDTTLLGTQRQPTCEVTRDRIDGKKMGGSETVVVLPIYWLYVSAGI